MKHDLKIISVLIFFFIVAQVVGLFLLNQEMTVQVIDGTPTPTYEDTSLGPRPAFSGFASFLYLAIGVAIGTVLVLVIAKFKKFGLWRFWFLAASFLAMTLAIGALIEVWIAMLISAVLAYLKVYKRNLIVHNVTEVLMYSGIAVFFVPLLNLTYAIVILLVFSAYDAFAVWKSKHMISMAEFQAESNLFAGLSFPYSTKDANIKMDIKEMKMAEKGMKEQKEAGVEPEDIEEPDYRTAILGGGDIAIPLLFTGAVMQWLINTGLGKTVASLQSFIVTITAAIALFTLFYLSKKDRYYPAMPFISTGCFVGLLIVYLI